jgi:hypothetical protein
MCSPRSNVAIGLDCDVYLTRMCIGRLPSRSHIVNGDLIGRWARQAEHRIYPRTKLDRGQIGLRNDLCLVVLRAVGSCLGVFGVRLDIVKGP